MKATPKRRAKSEPVATPIGNPNSPYIFTEEAAKYLRFGSVQLFREWVWRYGVPHRKRGRRMLFTKSELDAFMAEQAGV